MSTSANGEGLGWRPLQRRDDAAKALPLAPPPLCATGLFFLSLFLITFTACGGGGGAPLPEGPTTLAYVVSDCRDDGQTWTAHEALQIRPGESDPITVVEFSGGPVPAQGQCQSFGGLRWGLASVTVGPLQRLGVSPDGSLVVFEVTDDFSLLSQSQVPPEQEGIYVVHADGSDLRRLGPASRYPCFRVQLNVIVTPFLRVQSERPLSHVHGPGFRPAPT